MRGWERKRGLVGQNISVDGVVFRGQIVCGFTLLRETVMSSTLNSASEWTGLDAKRKHGRLFDQMLIVWWSFWPIENGLALPKSASFGCVDTTKRKVGHQEFTAMPSTAR